MGDLTVVFIEDSAEEEEWRTKTEFSSTLFETWKPIMRTTDMFYLHLFSKLLCCKTMPYENFLLMTSHSLNYTFNIHFPLVSTVCFLKRRNNLGPIRKKPPMSWAQLFHICQMLFKISQGNFNPLHKPTP